MTDPRNTYLRDMQNTSLLFGANNVFVEGLYEDYLRSPDSVSAEWRAYFDKLQVAHAQQDVAHSPIQQGFLALSQRQPETTGHAEETRKQASVLQLINAHRFLGVRIAELDPLKRHAKPEVVELNPAYYGLGEADMGSTFFTGSLVGGARMMSFSLSTSAAVVEYFSANSAAIFQACSHSSACSQTNNPA